MPEEEVGVVRGVRTPVNFSRETRPRTLDERILARFPGLVRVTASVWSRLPPRSRLRRAWTSRIIRQGTEAANRRDFELLALFFDPESEHRYEGASPVGGFLPPDLVGVHRGPETYRRLWEAGDEAWEGLGLEPEEVIDFGDRLLTVGRQTGRGRSTGIPLDEPIYQLLTLRRGLVIRHQDFDDRDRALQAAGLREQQPSSRARPGAPAPRSQAKANTRTRIA